MRLTGFAVTHTAETLNRCAFSLLKKHVFKKANQKSYDLSTSSLHPSLHPSLPPSLPTSLPPFSFLPSIPPSLPPYLPSLHSSLSILFHPSIPSLPLSLPLPHNHSLSSLTQSHPEGLHSDRSVPLLDQSLVHLTVLTASQLLPHFDVGAVQLPLVVVL